MEFIEFDETVAETALKRELWRLCAGPLVNLPHVGDVVYYFPQGHIEQVEALMNQGVDQQMPNYGVSEKIVCQVLSVKISVILLLF